MEISTHTEENVSNIDFLLDDINDTQTKPARESVSSKLVEKDGKKYLDGKLFSVLMPNGRWEMVPGHPRVGGKKLGTKHKKKRPLSDVLQTMLNEEIEVKDKNSDKIVKMKRADILIDQLYKSALSGNTKAIDIIFSRIEGNAPQTVNITKDKTLAELIEEYDEPELDSETDAD